MCTKFIWFDINDLLAGKVVSISEKKNWNKVLWSFSDQLDRLKRCNRHGPTVTRFDGLYVKILLFSPKVDFNRWKTFLFNITYGTFWYIWTRSFRWNHQVSIFPFYSKVMMKKLLNMTNFLRCGKAYSFQTM